VKFTQRFNTITLVNAIANVKIAINYTFTAFINLVNVNLYCANTLFKFKNYF